jgi:phage baseplate assembly protein W
MIKPNISKQPDYSDLDLDFLAHPTTKDVVKKTGEDAIKRSVRNLVLTNFYERPFRSYIGSNASKLLFENITPLTATFLKNAIYEVLKNYEPRIRVLNVDIDIREDNNGYNASISYVILNRNLPITISLFLERIR